MAADPITFKDKGDRVRLVGEHAFYVLGLDENGRPVAPRYASDGGAVARANIVTVIPTLDTSIYASGDTLFNATTVTNAVRTTTGTAKLQSLQIIDKDDQGVALDLYLFDTTGLTFGTLNAAPSISDANAAKLLGVISIASGDWKDLGGAKVVSISDIGIIVQPASGRSIAVAAVTGGTPTHTASGLVLRLGFLS